MMSFMPLGPFSLGGKGLAWVLLDHGTLQPFLAQKAVPEELL